MLHSNDDMLQSNDNMLQSNDDEHDEQKTDNKNIKKIYLLRNSLP